MLSKIRQNLSLRLGLIVISSSCLLTLLTVIFFYTQTFRGVIDNTNQSIIQLASTIEDSAAIACYLDNQEMATEVVLGLTKNDIVAGVILESATGMKHQEGNIEIKQNLFPKRFPLKSPFFEDEQAGLLTVYPNQELIEKRAKDTALNYAKALILYSALIIGLASFFVNKLLVKPLTQVANILNKIEPGSDQRLSYPKTHEEDEIGYLVKHSNILLDSVESTLEKERRLGSEMERLARQFRLIFENASSGIGLFDATGQLHIYNESFEQLIGEQRINIFQESKDNVLTTLFQNPQYVKSIFKQSVQGDSPVAVDIQLKGLNDEQGLWIHCLFSKVIDSDGQLLIEIIAHDITERTERELKSKREAELDHLTNLCNRRSGQRGINQLLEKTISTGCLCAFYLIDLDGFKAINDTYGHDVGDRVLVEVSNRLRSAVRNEDLVIRWGGDEFLVVLQLGQQDESVKIMAEKILGQFETPIDLENGHLSQVTASIGVSVAPTISTNAEELFIYADLAMYDIKGQGKNNYQIYLK